jgi:ubiquinone/menaquinone biosynthesis C-methylase UbiE
MLMYEEMIKEQLAYYSAVASQYDRGALEIAQNPDYQAAWAEWSAMQKAVQQLGRGLKVLEIACGTGVWTQSLLPISASITALDGSPQMIEQHRAKFGNDSRLHYQLVDLFTWQPDPDQQYDLVFFSFWISHIPQELLSEFLEKVYRAVRPGGQVFLIDEPGGGKLLSGATDDGVQQTRQLEDGSTYRVVKVYYDPYLVHHALEQIGFEQVNSTVGGHFFYVHAFRRDE